MSESEAIAARETFGSARAGRREPKRRLLAIVAADWLCGRIESLPELDQLCDAFGRGEVEGQEAWLRATALVIGATKD